MADVVEEIKSRLGIEEVVSQYVQLKKLGRNLKGLCPFHSEKTPSFVVSPEKQICHCFGCNKGGDIFTFIQELEGVNFRESLQILADRAGVKIDDKKLAKKVDKDEKDIYFEAQEIAAKFFEEQLLQTDEGKKVLNYLYKRGVNDGTIREFRLGFAPDSFDALHPVLLKKRIPKNVILKSGLASAKNIGDERIYDKYRLRLIFPIFDYLGRICGFGGRALQKEQQPKYLNSPENPVYSKSKVIYGLSHAKKYIKEEDKAVIVEGYFDVILPHQEGIKNVVASSGTAFSAGQVRQVKRLTKNVISCFDSDKAGFEASRRAYFMFREEGVEIKTIALEQKDPADFVLEHGGEFKKMVDNAKNFVSFFIERLILENDIAALSGRNEVISQLLPCFDGMSAVNRDYFVRELAGKLNMDQKFLYDEIANMKLPRTHPARAEGNVSGSRKFPSQEVLISILLEYPLLFPAVKDLLKNLDQNLESDVYLKNVYNALTDQYNSTRGKFVGWSFDDGCLADASGKVAVWRLYAEDRYANFSEQTLEEEVKKLIDKLRKDRRNIELKEIQRQIGEAEDSGDKEKLKSLLATQQGLLKLS
ncbi:DNA primase [Candidatus Peregrinibacteria bacterium]|nr:DNA primase [Candidatus Peregrinibacteria bacterium]